MERQALIAAVLCLIVLIAYQEGVHYFYPPPPEGAVPEAAVEPTPPNGNATEPPPDKVAGDAAPVPVVAIAGVTIPIETDTYSARVSTVGGRLVSFRLKRFRTAVEES